MFDASIYIKGDAHPFSIISMLYMRNNMPSMMLYSSNPQTSKDLI